MKKIPKDIYQAVKLGGKKEGARDSGRLNFIYTYLNFFSLLKKDFIYLFLERRKRERKGG